MDYSEKSYVKTSKIAVHNTWVWGPAKQTSDMNQIGTYFDPNYVDEELTFDKYGKQKTLSENYVGLKKRSVIKRDHQNKCTQPESLETAKVVINQAKHFTYTSRMRGITLVSQLGRDLKQDNQFNNELQTDQCCKHNNFMKHESIESATLTSGYSASNRFSNAALSDSSHFINEPPTFDCESRYSTGNVNEIVDNWTWFFKGREKRVLEAKLRCEMKKRKVQQGEGRQTVRKHRHRKLDQLYYAPRQTKRMESILYLNELESCNHVDDNNTSLRLKKKRQNKPALPKCPRCCIKVASVPPNYGQSLPNLDFRNPTDDSSETQLFHENEAELCAHCGYGHSQDKSCLPEICLEYSCSSIDTNGNCNRRWHHADISSSLEENCQLVPNDDFPSAMTTTSSQILKERLLNAGRGNNPMLLCVPQRHDRCRYASSVSHLSALI
ncbi:uncharacterized protein LOC115628750 [Scaptodrosophila lebanonensis]|uniref:Uncharacterized protein LOC115628750 n=1 Tax=Drosophila lebanonensis TaxID=7225 RepID=A0A6J2U039_DROLE|nr:uncharacterized protein LOC115628750 [Scaptodrosophila lebanonensis]